MTAIIDKIKEKNYTSLEVATAIGRQLDHWSRVRHRYIARYNLRVIRVGRRLFYQKDLVDAMVEDILKNGDQ